MKISRFIIPLLLCAVMIVIAALGFIPMKERNHWTKLFNGKDLSGWDTYLAPDMDDSGKPITGKPIGLNNDPRHVFTIVKDSGENVIRISGENWGAISTKKEYANYHFQLQFKWGLLSWGQKKGKKKDSGLLYNSVGEYGADYGSWMRSQEFQIEQGNCGDYWGVAGGMADIPVIKKSDTAYVYTPGAPMLAFSQVNKQGRHCIKKGDAENPTGQWNTLDLYCSGDTSIHVVNGKVMMILYHNRQIENDKEVPLDKGKIQIQSEGAEVYYRHIKITPINGLPVALLNQ